MTDCLAFDASFKIYVGDGDSTEGTVKIHLLDARVEY